jgi:hypothetical protein
MSSPTMFPSDDCPICKSGRSEEYHGHTIAAGIENLPLGDDGATNCHVVLSPKQWKKFCELAGLDDEDFEVP